MSTKTEYINNRDFLDALVKYKEQSIINKNEGKSRPKIPNYIGECFIKIAENLAKRPNFYGYSFKDEMISDAIENSIMYFENFDPNKSKNPFAYFTQISWYAFVRRIAKEKKQQYIKYKATESFGALDENELIELGNGEIKQLEIYDNMYEFISAYEESDIKKRITTEKPKGVELFLEDLTETLKENESYE